MTGSDADADCSTLHPNPTSDIHNFRPTHKEHPMPVTNTDAVLWYNVGEFGKAGYAVPNWSNDVGSLNPQILDWTYLVGRNLFHIMHHEDADLRIPPSINTAKRIHKLYIRAGNILAGRAVPPGENNMEVSTPGRRAKCSACFPCRSSSCATSSCAAGPS